MTSAEAMKKLANQARTDPQFFHELVFDPDKVISGLTFLDERSKQALLRVNPDTIIRNLFPGGDVMECGDTCGAGSCGLTCGPGSCLDTCKSSCGGTCGNSCEHTSGMGPKIIVEDPLKQGIVAKGVGAKRAGGAVARKGQR